MILDSLLFSQIKIIGSSLLSECNLKNNPQNIEEMKTFLLILKSSIEQNEFKGVLIADILFSFVSNIHVRDRNTTARNFEDIFSALFDCSCTDGCSRVNPYIPDKILEYNHFCQNENWNISTDLSSNKREKSDLLLGNYAISLKTLKGPAYNKSDILIDSSVNTELNVGSFSYRALLKGILPDSSLNLLSDRKKRTWFWKSIKK